MDPSEFRHRERFFRQMGALEWEACRRSPVYWIERYAWTVDEHRKVDNERRLFHGEPFIDPKTLLPGRGLDSGKVDDYLLYVAALWWNVDRLAVPKSRQLRMTHLMVNLHGWLGMAYAGQLIAVQSKKLEDADATLQRLDTSLRVMRRKAPFVPFPEHRYKHARIIFPNGSMLMGVAQGAAVVRQYTFSAIMSDETAFQPEAEDAYVAAMPTVEGGGKYTAISSAHPGFFERLVHDRLEDQR
jgi:hypothetical protein